MLAEETQSTFCQVRDLLSILCMDPCPFVDAAKSIQLHSFTVVTLIVGRV